MLRDGLNDAFSDKHSGWHAEDLVESQQITRAEQDRWAERSQQRFAAAQSAGKFTEEIAPVELCERNKPGLFQKDEHNRPETTMASLGKLRPAFRKDGTITAGNAPGLNSGAAAMIVADAMGGEERPQAARASRVLWHRRGRARHVRLGPVPAVRQALDVRVGQSRTSTAWRSTRPLRPSRLQSPASLVSPEDVVNVEGGAIAHGHPIGATGAVLTTRLLHSMQRDGLKRGVVTLCIGGGQGIALALENLR